MPKRRANGVPVKPVSGGKVRNPERVSHIGIYSGSFDPIHDGHIAFAEAAKKKCGLDKIYFLAEPRPRRKQGVRALEHREAMVRLAIDNVPYFGMIQLEQAKFSVEETLPKLTALFAGAEMFFLMGDDVFEHLSTWPHVEELLTASSFIVGIRKGDEAHTKDVLKKLEKTRGMTFSTSFLMTEEHGISSSSIRNDLKRNKEPAGLPAGVLDYIRKNGLYTANQE